jgi:uncharacterized protein (TIGR02596 family)
MRRCRALINDSGFSLIELLVVCAVIGVIAGFAVPAVVTMVRGTQLTQGSQLISDQIALARQTAISRNRSIEVRIYRYSDPEVPGEDPKKPEDGKFRSFQIFELLENGAALPLNKAQRLPATVVMNKGEISTLLNHLPLQKASASSGDPELAVLPADSGGRWNYLYVSFRFRPDGSTDLPITGPSNGRWYVTLHGNESPEELSKPPANYFTLQIDPVSGATKSYRPNAG